MTPAGEFLPLNLVVWLLGFAVYFDLKYLRKNGADVWPGIGACVFLLSYFLLGTYVGNLIAIQNSPILLLLPIFIWLLAYLLYRIIKNSRRTETNGISQKAPSWTVILFWIVAILYPVAIIFELMLRGLGGLD
jgi:hypothetical protein